MSIGFVRVGDVESMYGFPHLAFGYYIIISGINVLTKHERCAIMVMNT